MLMLASCEKDTSAKKINSIFCLAYNKKTAGPGYEFKPFFIWQTRQY